MSRSVCAACGIGFPSWLAPTPAQTLEVMNVLRSNALPLDAGALQRAILDTPTELARYDVEIGRLQTVLERLVRERAALATYADRCRSVFSPIRRLPTELLAEIFAMCSPAYCSELADEYDLWEANTPKQELDRLSNHSLLQLSQVSALWNQTAMGTPKLWSTILLNTSLWSAATAPKLLSTLEFALKQGGNHPLTMCIAVLEEDPLHRAVLELLSQHALRWKDVYFYSDREAGQFLRCAKGSLDCLERLNVCAAWRGVDIFQTAPKLTEVTFRGRVEDVPDLPWDQIRTFTYTDELHMNPFTFLILLGCCQSILAFDADIGFSDLAGATMPFVSSDVESLSLELALAHSARLAQPVVGRIFETLTLPSLHALDLRPRADSASAPVWDAQAFLALADRSSFHSHLTRIGIKAIITDQELLRCLAVLPLLDELDVHDCTSGDNVVITDALLQGLTLQVGGKNLVPNLTFLCFQSLIQFSDTCYRDLIASRLPKKPGDCFEAYVGWIPGCRREFPSELLSDLDYGGTFYFNSGPA
ncbi:hypothetical protein DFH06DRAFT_1467181 [Mycena polygramma]|nr:hypothetical protein DFH06DRAFT_1467181 [Mycena polygramma]